MADQVSLLKGIAKQFGKRVRALNLFDPQVCTSPTDPDHPWMNLPLPGDFFRDQLSFEYRGRKVQLRANSEFLFVQISGSFAVDVFSINRRNYDMPVNQVPLRVPGFQALPVFAGQSRGHLEELLSSAALRQALSKLQLTDKESLHLYADAIVLYLQRASEQEIVSAIEAACILAEQLPIGSEGKVVDLEVLPSKFKTLTPLIRKWGVTDDDERSERLEKASQKTLERLVKSVIPHLSSIDEYLDSFGTKALSEGAIALGALAECALEAQLRLDQSNPKR